MPNQKKLISVTAIIIFVLSFSFGLVLAQHKPLWLDEIFSQARVVDKHNVWELLTIQFHEGNKAPLFYILQELSSLAFDYSFPFEWQREEYVTNSLSQLIMRLSPNLCMSLVIASMFYFFAKEFSFLTGLFAALVCLSSSTTWLYWAEARHYSLWILLTTWQIMLLLKIFQSKKINPKIFTYLFITHLLLAVTVVLSLLQIFCAAVLLFTFMDRDWKKQIFLTLIPSCVCFYFLHISYNFQFGVLFPVSYFVFQNFHLEYLLLSLIGLGMLFYNRGNPHIDFKENLKVASIALMYLASAVFLFIKFIISEKMHGPGHFTVHPRYFVFIAPIGFISFTYFSAQIFKSLKNNLWGLINMCLLISGLLMIRFLNTYITLTHLAVYL